jgi:hypothetical protein
MTYVAPRKISSHSWTLLDPLALIEIRLWSTTRLFWLQKFYLNYACGAVVEYIIEPIRRVSAGSGRPRILQNRATAAQRILS